MKISEQMSIKSIFYQMLANFDELERESWDETFAERVAREASVLLQLADWIELHAPNQTIYEQFRDDLSALASEKSRETFE